MGHLSPSMGEICRLNKPITDCAAPALIRPVPEKSVTPAVAVF